MGRRRSSWTATLRRAGIAVALISAIVVGSDPGGAQAANRVGLNGDPCSYETIGDAINDAVEGDIVFVSPGTYDETIGFIDFDLSIVGSDASCIGTPPGGPSTVVVDGEGAGATNGGMAEVFEAELIVRDLTLRDTRSEADGGLLYADAGILDLTRVWLFDGFADGDGGAIAAVNDATVIVDDGLFRDNVADGDGGAIALDGGALILQDSIVIGSASIATAASPPSADNGGLIAITDGADGSILRSQLVNGRSSNRGGALRAEGLNTAVDVVGGSLEGNFASVGGAVDVGEGASVLIDGALLNNNDAVESSTAHVEAPEDSQAETDLTLLESQVSGGTGEGSVRGVGNVRLEVISSSVSGYNGSAHGAVDASTGAQLDIVDSTISNNISDGSPANASGLTGSEATILLLRSEVVDNGHEGDSAGGVQVGRGTEFSAIQSLIARNDGHYIGALVAGDSGVRLIDSVVADNTGGRIAGVLVTGIDGSLEMDSSSIVDNVTTDLASPPDDLQSSGLVVGNSGFTSSFGVPADVYNSIVWGNTGGSGPIEVFADEANWTSSIVESSGGSAAWDTDLGADLGGNFDVDPLLDEQWMPASDSPARDAGNQLALPTDEFDLDEDGDVSELLPVDFAGRPRIRGAQVDIGALERPDRQFVLDSRPCVIYDTYAATGSLSGRLDGGEIRTLQATGTTPAAQGITNSCIPTGADAGLFHVRAYVPDREGNFRLSAAGVEPNGGVVNFAALPTTSFSLENSNTVPSEFGFNGFLDLAANAGPAGAGSPTAGASIHTVGYFADDIPSSETGLDFFPLTPCAVLDSRSNQGAGFGFVGPFTGTTGFDIDVTGDHPAGQGGGSTNCGVPESAEGVILNMVAINPTGAGVIGAVSDDSVLAFGVTSFADLPMNNANTMIVPIADDGTVQVTSNPLFGSVHIRAVVLGYVDDEPGLQFNPLPPCAAFDSRSTQGAIGSFAGTRTSGSPTTYQISGSTLPAAQGGQNGGDCGVPVGTEFVMVNLVAINAVAAGNLRADAAGSTPTGGVLNFALLDGSMNNSNAVPISLDELGRMDVFANGGPVPDGTPLTDVRGVILGYFD